jgi:hypothetical protein
LKGATVTREDEDFELEDANGVAHVVPRPSGGNGENGETEEEGRRYLNEESPAPRNDPHLAELEAEIAKLRGELARSKALSGLDGRREEPATVGDVLDALEAQAAAQRAEAIETWRRHYNHVYDEIAGRVEGRLFDRVNGQDEEDDENRGAPGVKNGKQGKGKTRPGRKRHRLYLDENGNAYIWSGADEEDEVPDDGVIATAAS